MRDRQDARVDSHLASRQTKSVGLTLAEQHKLPLRLRQIGHGRDALTHTLQHGGGVRIITKRRGGLHSSECIPPHRAFHGGGDEIELGAPDLRHCGTGCEEHEQQRQSRGTETFPPYPIDHTAVKQNNGFFSSLPFALARQDMSGILCVDADSTRIWRRPSDH